MDLIMLGAGIGAALGAFWLVLRLDNDPFEKRYQETQNWLLSQRRMAQALERK
jgi:hypothetical protein